MKTKTFKKLTFALAGTAFILSSCVNDDKNLYESKDEVPTNTKDLVVPEGFDWTMTHNVTLSTNSPCATSASIFLDEECTDMIGKLPVQEGESQMTFEIPSANSAIWIKYPTSTGDKKITASINKTVTRSGAGSWTANSLFADATTQTGINNNCVYQPAKDKFGTLMFEDMWPERGDYDFNDFVVNYNMVAAAKDVNTLTATITLKMRAMGGSYPYRLCIQLFGNAVDDNNEEVSSPDIKKENVTITSIEKTNIANASVELLDAKKAIIALTGFDQLRKSNGGQYYNSEKAYTIASSEKTPTIKFTLEINIGNQSWYQALQWFSNQFAFDYFLQRTDNNREIHISGYKPTELYKNYEKDLAGRTEKPYYCSSDRFVWALKAPEEMSWAVEKQDIINVYTKFADWVTSGGDLLENNTDPLRWYKTTYRTNNEDLYIDHKKH